MLVTNSKKVILHLHKCAGSSVRWAIIKAGYEYLFSCEHAPIKMLPDKYADWDRIGFIRNPIDWYLSYFHYFKCVTNKRKINSGVMYYVLSDGNTLSFDQFIDNALNLREFFKDENNLKLLRSRIRVVVMNTYDCRHAFTWDDVSAITHDDFTDSLLDYKFKLLGLDTARVYRIEDGIQNALNKEFNNPKIVTQRRNVSPKMNKSVVTTEMKNKIFQRDRFYFDKFGYEIIR
jgi:hypothetical protein